jgi:hypothetical protein
VGRGRRVPDLPSATGVSIPTLDAIVPGRERKPL